MPPFDVGDGDLNSDTQPCVFTDQAISLDLVWFLRENEALGFFFLGGGVKYYPTLSINISTNRNGITVNILDFF